MNNPQFGGAPQASPNIMLAIASMGLAVVGILFLIPTIIFYICGIVPILLGIAAVVTGLLAKVKAKKDPQKWGGGGLGLAGAIVGAFSIVLPLLYIILMVALMVGISATSQTGR